MKPTTLVFLVKRQGDAISEICLAMKKRGFGKGRWNGVGGKVLDEEEIEHAARRETQEEIGVTIDKVHKIAELSFEFPHNQEWSQTVHTYFAYEWEGEPTESEEMRPEWFNVADIPYASMWPDDIFWLPKVLAGEKIKASFTFAPGDIVLKHDIKTVEGFV
ncbi:MAG: 8-oxo-dGTP diphosphatase [Patescibacteria group bacterium]